MGGEFTYPKMVPFVLTRSQMKMAPFARSLSQVFGLPRASSGLGQASKTLVAQGGAFFAQGRLLDASRHGTCGRTHPDCVSAIQVPTRTLLQIAAHVSMY